MTKVLKTKPKTKTVNDKHDFNKAKTRLRHEFKRPRQGF